MAGINLDSLREREPTALTGGWMYFQVGDGDAYKVKSDYFLGLKESNEDWSKIAGFSEIPTDDQLDNYFEDKSAGFWVLGDEKDPDAVYLVKIIEENGVQARQWIKILENVKNRDIDTSAVDIDDNPYFADEVNLTESELLDYFQGEGLPSGIYYANNNTWYYDGTTVQPLGRDLSNKADTNLENISVTEKGWVRDEIQAANGGDNINSGEDSGSLSGYDNINSGLASASVGGDQNTNSGEESASIGGSLNENSGKYSSSIAGEGLISGSFSEVSKGRYNEELTPYSSEYWDERDLIEGIGGGSNFQDRKNIFSRWKSGAWKWVLKNLANIPSETLEKGLHSADEDGVLNHYDGVEWKKYAFADGSNLGTFLEDLMKIADWTDSGKLRADKLPDLAITSVLVASESTLGEFATNNDNYTFEQGDVIIIDESHYIFKGGDKSVEDNYSEITVRELTMSQIIGLLDALELKTDKGGYPGTTQQAVDEAKQYADDSDEHIGNTDLEVPNERKINLGESSVEFVLIDNSGSGFYNVEEGVKIDDLNRGELILTKSKTGAGGTISEGSSFSSKREIYNETTGEKIRSFSLNTSSISSETVIDDLTTDGSPVDGYESRSTTSEGVSLSIIRILNSIPNETDSSILKVNKESLTYNLNSSNDSSNSDDRDNTTYQFDHKGINKSTLLGENSNGYNVPKNNYIGFPIHLDVSEANQTLFFDDEYFIGDYNDTINDLSGWSNDFTGARIGATVKFYYDKINGTAFSPPSIWKFEGNQTPTLEDGKRYSIVLEYESNTRINAYIREEGAQT